MTTNQKFALACVLLLGVFLVATYIIGSRKSALYQQCIGDGLKAYDCYAKIYGGRH